MSSRNWLVGVGASTFVHVMCARAALHMEPPAPPPPPPMVVELAPPPPPPKPVEEPKPEPEPPKSRPTVRRQTTAAKAGRVIAAEPSATNDAPVDFSIVQGAADAYVGGTTSAVGTSDTPVRGPVTPQATVTSEGTAIAASPEGSEWDCTALYPTDPSAGDAAAVMVQVRVDGRGKPVSVQVLRDPGHGFGPAARGCAMLQTYQPARDRNGNAVLGRTKPFLVRFHR